MSTSFTYYGKDKKGGLCGSYTELAAWVVKLRTIALVAISTFCHIVDFDFLCATQNP